MAEVQCSKCNNKGEAETYTGLSTAGLIVFIVLLLACFPLCWIPFVTNSLKENKKRCKACGFKFEKW